MIWFVLLLASYVPAALITGLTVRSLTPATDPVEDPDPTAPRWAWGLLALLWALFLPVGVHFLAL